MVALVVVAAVVVVIVVVAASAAVLVVLILFLIIIIIMYICTAPNSAPGAYNITIKHTGNTHETHTHHPPISIAHIPKSDQTVLSTTIQAQRSHIPKTPIQIKKELKSNSRH